MPVTTRNGRKTTQDNPDSRSTAELPSQPFTSDEKPPSYYLLFYIILLVLGSLYSVISPNASTSSNTLPLAAGITSDANIPSSISPVNYFAYKRNFLNLYFVKLGWVWTTLAFLLIHLTTTRPSSSSTANSKTKTSQHNIQALARYALITTSWFLVTQWFFGPALIDRSFTITGGHCETQTPALDPLSSSSTPAEVDMTTLTSSLACKASGGHWRGGHDISGHIFMLVLSSACLLLELYIADRHASHPHISPRAAASLAHDMTEEEKVSIGGWESESAAKIRVYSRYFVWTVVVLDVWMILMTAIWFHTWTEKLSGLVLGSGTIWLVYWLPEFAQGWRAIVGGL